MAVEVVLRYVRDDRNVRADARQRFELKTGDLHDGDVSVTEFIRAGDNGHADIAASNTVLPSRAEDLVDHRDRRRLAVRTRDRDDRRAQKQAAQFRLADDPLFPFAEGDGQFMIDGDAGAEDEHVAFLHRGSKFLRPHNARAARRKFRHRAPDPVRRQIVVEINSRASVKQKGAARRAAL